MGTKQDISPQQKATELRALLHQIQVGGGVDFEASKHSTINEIITQLEAGDISVEEANRQLAHFDSTRQGDYH